MKYWFARGKVNISSTRGTLGGFLVIYGDTARYSDYDSVGHDDLLRDIASRNRMEKSHVLDNGIRLFYTYIAGGIVISGVREIDNLRIEKDPGKYARIIRKVLH